MREDVISTVFFWLGASVYCAHREARAVSDIDISQYCPTCGASSLGDKWKRPKFLDQIKIAIDADQYERVTRGE